MKRSEIGPVEASSEEFRSHIHRLEERRSSLQEARIQLSDRLNRLAQHVLPPQVSGGTLTDPALHGAKHCTDLMPELSSPAYAVPSRVHELCASSVQSCMWPTATQLVRGSLTREKRTPELVLLSQVGGTVAVYTPVDDNPSRAPFLCALQL